MHDCTFKNWVTLFFFSYIALLDHKRPPSRSILSDINEKSEEGSQSKHATGKGIWKEKPGTAAGNAGVKFDAGSKGKLAKKPSGRDRRVSEEEPKRPAAHVLDRRGAGVLAEGKNEIGKGSVKRTEKTRGSPKRKRKNERKRKREEDSKRKRRDTKSKATTEPGTAAGNAGVKFDAGSKGKLAKNRPDETGGSPKRSRKGKNKEKKARTSFTQKSASRPVQKHYYRSKGSRVFTQKSASPCTKTVLQK